MEFKSSERPYFNCIQLKVFTYFRIILYAISAFVGCFVFQQFLRPLPPRRGLRRRPTSTGAPAAAAVASAKIENLRRRGVSTDVRFELDLESRFELDLTSRFELD